MQNNCTTSDRFKRFVFQRCRLQLVVNVKKKYTKCKYATLHGYETVARWAITLHTPVLAYASGRSFVGRSFGRSFNQCAITLHTPVHSGNYWRILTSVVSARNRLLGFRNRIGASEPFLSQRSGTRLRRKKEPGAVTKGLAVLPGRQ